MPLKVKLRSRLQTAAVKVELKSNRTRSSNWRTKLQEDPVRYEAYKKDDAVRASIYRLSMSQEKKKDYNEGCKQRMRKYRQSKREQQMASKNGSKDGNKDKKKPHTTRALTKQQEAKRKAQAQKMRQWRMKLTPVERDQINRKRREKRQQERLELNFLHQQKREEARQKQEKLKKKAEEQVCLQEERNLMQLEEERAASSSRSKSAKRKARSRGLKGLLNSPKKFADTVIDILEKASPRKKQALKDHGLDLAHLEVQRVLANSIAEQLDHLKKSRKKKDLERKHAIARMFVALKKYRWPRRSLKAFKITPKCIERSVEGGNSKKTNRSLADSTKKLIQGFYEEAALQLPEKRYISKKTLMKTGFLQEPITVLFAKFRNIYPEVKISISRFYQERPKHIKPVGCMKYRGCLCEYCTNVELKVEAINNFYHSRNMRSKIQGAYGVARLTMCQKDGKYNRRACINRQCKGCGTKNLSLHLADILRSHSTKPMQWNRWEKSTLVSGGKNVTKLMVVTKNGTLQECVDELSKEAEILSSHLFTASWQYQQYLHLTKNLPSGWVTMVLDFAENYTCQYQSEVQSAHWYHSNVTIHPIVCTYACPLCKESMQESIIFITSDKCHDYHAVHTFMLKAIEHLSHKLPVKKVVRFSDGCACQYKSKGPFVDVVQSKSLYKVPVEHNYFGSRHGKGPSDGETAVVKRQASQAVLGGKVVINDAKDLYTYCKKEVEKSPTDEQKCLHFQRTFFFVESVDRNRGHENLQLKTVKGTRQVHSVRSADEIGNLQTRNLTCYCTGCLSRETCIDKDYVDDWDEKTLYLQHQVEVQVASVQKEKGDAENQSCRLATSSTTSHSSSRYAGLTNIKMEMEKYYAVFYTNEFYIGRLTRLEGEIFWFKFLHRVRNSENKERTYDWPKRSDVAAVQPQYVINGPLSMVGSGPFTVNELEESDLIYNRMKGMKRVEQ